MKYLIDIGHPAHVHYFRNFSKDAIGKGNKVLFTCRDKEMSIALLEYYNFEHLSFGKNFKTKPGKIFGLLYFTLRLFIVAVKFKPDIYLNASMYSAIVSWIMRKPHISLEDTYNKEQVNLYMPFTNCVLTGNYDHPSLGRKEIRYSGYQELLYLHPSRFTPDKNVIKELGVTAGEKYVIIRFVSWNASHDYGHTGISFENKIKAVEEFSKHAKVFVSSEKELPEELKKYQFKIAPEKMHDAIAFASLVIGESFTMLSEAAVLGTPAILIHNTTCFYLQEQEVKHELVFTFSEALSDQQLAIQKGVELLQQPNIKKQWQQKRDKMLADKIDVTAFLVWFIENYPESKRIMKENPEYQYKFK